MAAFSYFTLISSDSSMNSKFRVILSGRRRMLQKKGSIETTIDGNLDAAIGSIQERHQYVVRVRETETEIGYGSMVDLEAFFRLNNPNGVPSTVITLIDHFGASHNVLMWGDFDDQLMGIDIEGVTAWSLVNCLFVFIPIVEGS